MQSLDTTHRIIDAAESLNAIVAHYPRALAVLQRFGLDTCCGGALPLRTAAEHHNLNLDELLAMLRAAVGEEAR
jgi:iron-sulfur cluster repair protein YtfE (RIC family)